MLVFRRILLLGSLLVLARIAIATPSVASARAVKVQYRLAEQSPDRLETILGDLVARAMVAIPRVAQVRSRFDHGATFFEIQFDGGANESDLAVVASEIDRLQLGDKLDIISREITLVKPLPADAF